MEPAFDSNAPKKPTNLPINSDLLQQAKALNITLSKTLEKRLIQLLPDTVDLCGGNRGVVGSSCD